MIFDLEEAKRIAERHGATNINELELTNDLVGGLSFAYKGYNVEFYQVRFLSGLVFSYNDDPPIDGCWEWLTTNDLIDFEQHLMNVDNWC